MLEAAGNYRQINPARRRRTGGLLDAALAAAGRAGVDYVQNAPIVSKGEGHDDRF